LVRNGDDRRRDDRRPARERAQRGVPVPAVRDGAGARRALKPTAVRAPDITRALRRRR